MKTKKKKKKYSLGTGKNGVVRNYIESPSETLVENDIAMAKAKEKAANNGLANGLDIFGNMALQYGMSMAGGSKGVGKGIGQGFGKIFGGGEGANGGTIVAGPGKKKGTRDVTKEESIEEAEGSQFTPEGIMALFGVDEFEMINSPNINLGKYKDVGYFNPVKDAAGKYTLNNTKKNPANYALYKQQLKNIMKLNPDLEINMKGFTPLIDQKAFGGKTGVNVEVEGKEMGETPDGQLIDFQGPSHENGGINIELPEGTEIFSKRIKVAGKTMAERKKAREKKVMTLEKLLEKNGEDKVLQDTLKRTQKNNEIEENKDKKIQEIVSKAQNAAKQTFAFGTPPGGIEEDGILPGENKFQLPNFSGGDLLGLAGTLYSSFEPMNNTNANRAGDTPNINAFKDFGNDALDRIGEAKGYVASQRDNALKDLETSRAGGAKRNRNSARGVNTLRALDTASDMNINQAQGDIYDNFAKQMMSLVSQEAGFENAQDSAVMQGEQNRDLADRQDRDNYYTQLAQDIATKGEGIQTVGKMFNQNKANTAAEQAVNDSSINFQYDNGTLTDKAGNIVMTEAEIAKSAQVLGITPEEYINMINKQNNG